MGGKSFSDFARVMHALLDAALSDAQTDYDIAFVAMKSMMPDPDCTLVFWNEVPGLVRKLRALRYRGHA